MHPETPYEQGQADYRNPNINTPERPFNYDYMEGWYDALEMDIEAEAESYEAATMSGPTTPETVDPNTPSLYSPSTNRGGNKPMILYARLTIDGSDYFRILKINTDDIPFAYELALRDGIAYFDGIPFTTELSYDPVDDFGYYPEEHNEEVPDLDEAVCVYFAS